MAWSHNWQDKSDITPTVVPFVSFSLSVSPPLWPRAVDCHEIGTDIQLPPGTKCDGSDNLLSFQIPVEIMMSMMISRSCGSHLLITASVCRWTGWIKMVKIGKKSPALHQLVNHCEHVSQLMSFPLSVWHMNGSCALPCTCILYNGRQEGTPQVAKGFHVCKHMTTWP